MERKIIVGGVVVKNGKFAIVKEKAPDIAGLWNLPMGGLEDNEKIIDGAKREMEEETSLKVKIEKFIGVYHNPNRAGKNIFKFIFSASVMSGELRCPEDLDEVKWITLEELRKIPDDQMRDASLKKAAEDYFSGKSYPLDIITYYSDRIK